MKRCKNSNHKAHVAKFIKKYPSAKGRVPQTIILVDPNDWAVALESYFEYNAMLSSLQYCRRYCTSGKGIGTTGLGQICSCQWKYRV